MPACRRLPQRGSTSANPTRPPSARAPPACRAGGRRAAALLRAARADVARIARRQTSRASNTRTRTRTRMRTRVTLTSVHTHLPAQRHAVVVRRNCKSLDVRQHWQLLWHHDVAVVHIALRSWRQRVQPRARRHRDGAAAPLVCQTGARLACAAARFPRPLAAPWRRGGATCRCPWSRSSPAATAPSRACTAARRRTTASPPQRAARPRPAAALAPAARPPRTGGRAARRSPRS